MTILLRTPRLQELDDLTTLCMRSKQAWGYDDEFMEACRDELTLTQADLECGHLQVLECDGVIVGFVQVCIDPDGEVVLEKLFVAPESMGQGFGSKLWRWALEHARQQGASTLSVDSDPQAADFYRSQGASDDGVVPSGSIPGRTLPRLTISVAAFGRLIL